MDTINLYVVFKRCLKVGQHVVVPQDPDSVVTKEASEGGYVLRSGAEASCRPPLLVVQPQVGLASLVRAFGVIIPRGHPPCEDPVNWLESLSIKLIQYSRK